MAAKRHTMQEAFRTIQSADDFSYAIRDFVDRFAEQPSLSLIKEEPEPLQANLNDDGVADAWLAATAVYLASKYNLASPMWTRNNARALPSPWFAAKTPKLKTVLLQESPAAFRVRNLFVSANVLSRA